VIYLDTGCLLKLYYPEADSARVVQLVMGQVIAFVLLHELELANAIELKLFRKEARPGQARAMIALVEQDVRAGVLHRPSMIWDDVLRDSRTLARTHTRKIGCRSLDIMHCSAALGLSASFFISTDARQRRLATAIGLTCPVV